MRRVVLTVVGSLAPVLFLGCSQGSYTLVANLDPSVTGAQTVELALVPSCTGQTLGAPPAGASYDAFVRRGESAQTVGAAMHGSFGLYALARNDACGVVGAGCVPVTLTAGGKGELAVLVTAATGAACATSCDHGRCVSGTPDGGALDAADLTTPTDAGDGGGTDLGDASVPDGGGVDMPLDAGNPVDREHAAEALAWQAQCGCDTGGFPDAMSCVASNARNDAMMVCRQMGYAADPSGLDASFSCIATAWETAASCLRTSTCGTSAMGMCFDNRDRDQSACPNPSTTAETAYDDAYATCLDSIRGTGPDTCSDAAMPSSAVGNAVYTGTTVGAGDHRFTTTPPCDTGPLAPDVAFRWAAPMTGMYSFDTIGSAFDTILYVVPDCGAGTTATACADDSVGRASILPVMCTAGVPMQIIIDGWDRNEAGPFQLNIHAVP